MNFEYFLILAFNFLGFLFAFLLFILFYFIIYRDVDFEKLTAYECGFNPFEDAYGRFDVRFYLVAILFLIFDLEVTFIFPWTIMFLFLKTFGLWLMFFFILVLTLGFVYEWKRGALEWQ